MKIILRSAALLVPRELRGEWMREWLAELWYVRGSKHDFCLGAYQDAWWLRRNTPWPPVLESPLRCILMLASLAAIIGLIVAGFVPRRVEDLPSPYPDARNLVVISPSRHAMATGPGISLEDFRLWTTNTAHLFAGLAYYRPAVMDVEVAEGQTAKLTIARASGNLFELLRLGSGSEGSFVLSRAAWHRFFPADENAVGRVIEINGRPTRVAAVFSELDWQLPGKVDGWLLDLEALPKDSRGFVVARVRNSAFPPRADGLWHMTVSDGTGGYDRFDCASVAVKGRGQYTLIMVMAIACLILPVTTKLSLGEYPASSPAIRLRRWIFLGAKIGLVLAILCSAMPGLKYLGDHGLGGLAVYVLLWSCIFAFRWILTDQRRRCPVCLKVLGNPAHVGQASRIFLGWNGTEFMCGKGHGLLHVPDTPTSWYSTQRWMYLDHSWSGFFS
jgi:hypothetical protein